MIISNDKPCKQFSLLPLFAWADVQRNRAIAQYDAISHLQKEFGLSYHMAKIIAEKQDYSISNEWGI